MLTVQSSIIIVEDENARSSCNSLDPRLCHVHARFPTSVQILIVPICSEL